MGVDMSEKLALMETWMQRVWSDQEVAAIDELFVDTGRARGLAKQTLVGPKDFKVFHHAMINLLEDFKISIDHHIEQGDWISALITIEARSKTNQQPVSFTGHVHVEISQGQIQQAYNHIDFLGLFCQLGLLPNDCFEQGLSGCQVV